MPSQFPGFAYDIFISYRHNDNRSGWVGEFVKSLQEELAATIKDPVSVYFDTNPYDGLLETHNVDKSLEGKLKSLIFIPVISQTYCDTKSFAWRHEFVAFNKLAKQDSFGRDIRLSSGNVASRILPVKIHDLDAEDKATLEEEIGGMLRAIEFIFRSPGVNRPLSAQDKREENSNKTLYRDQVNKAANAIKEIIGALKNPGKTESVRIQDKVNEHAKEDLPEKSIAVLPFANLSQDPGQEYFADGITENILMQLSGLPHFRVISRTSVMRYKKTSRSAPEIAGELGVKYILEGSAQTHKDKVRINVQLINALLDQPVWSKVFMESMEDIFAIQNNVAAVVAGELNATVNPGQKAKLNEVPTKNLEAYDHFLKGRHAFNRWSVEGYRTATEYFKKAIALDPDFKQAYSYLASSYSARMSWNGDLAPNEALENIVVYLEEAWKRGPSDNDYLTKAFVEFFITKDFVASERFLITAIELNPNNATALYTYSYVLNMMGRFEEAAHWVDKAKAIDPLTVIYFNYWIISLYLLGKYDEALHTAKEALGLYPSVLRFYDFLGRIYLTMGRFEEARDALLSGIRSSDLRPPSMIAYLAVAWSKLHVPEKANELLKELIQRSERGEKGVNMYVAHIFNGLGDTASAIRWLEKARTTNDIDLIWAKVDPFIKHLDAKSSAGTSPDFEGAEKFITERLEKEMPALSYHNMDHIRDVIQSAQTIADGENLSPWDTKLVRLAALFHDAGFIYSPKNHEEKGAEMAHTILPSYGFSGEAIQSIAKMILATRLPQSPASILEKVLCDADLDYLGREDYPEIARRLLGELKAQGVVETDREWDLIQKTFLESHRYHTEYSKSYREPLKQKRLKEISARLK